MKHSSYFDGRVQSLGIQTEEGPATVGVITPGQYSFSTANEEHMIVTTGTLDVKLPGQGWSRVSSNEKFVVGPNETFEVKAEADVSYICYYK